MFNKVKDNVIFLFEKVFNSNKFFTVSEEKNGQVTFTEKQHIKINSFQKQNLEILFIGKLKGIFS